jgi:diadenosine tetraphosphate (Ap4A) HIT family hydrolase
MENDNLLNIHFHIIPRNHNFGGFEIGNGVYVTSKTPEEFAKKLYFE